jgi:hypothetical protein
MPPRPKPPARIRSIKVPCGTEVDRQFPGDHLLLGFRIQADVADDRLLHEAGTHQLADAHSRHRRVVGDHGEIALALAHQLVDHGLGSADGHEARRSSGWRRRG